MAAPAETARSPLRLHGLGRLRVAAIAFAAITLLVFVRAGCEWGMMREYGADPQMPIWGIMSAITLAFWFVTGSVLAGLLIAFWPNRWGAPIGTLLIVVWAIAISRASWEYQRGRQALADASDPSTSAEQLSELVHFDGIQGGYELDNRIASNPNTPPEALRELSKRDQLGTQMCLAENPNTPLDVLQELTNNKDADVIRDLRRNPNLPESIRRKLEDREEKTVGKPMRE